MRYLDFDVMLRAIDDNNEDEYEIAVHSPAGDGHERVHFPFTPLELEGHLKNVQLLLLRSGQKYRKHSSNEAQKVQAFGQQLFHFLFHGQLQNLFAGSRGKLSDDEGLRIRLRIQSSRLATLPWEYLYDPQESEYICLYRKTPLIRHPIVPQPIKTLMVPAPLRILGMIASPHDQMELDIEHEKHLLEKATHDARATKRIELEWLAGQTWHDLQRALRKGPWHVFHFIGHSGFDTYHDEGFLAFANEDHTTYKMQATQFARLLANPGTLRLVVLNSCEGARGSEHDIFSSTASILLQRAIPSVLAMQSDITDDAAIAFSHTFYESLADGMPVDAAVTEGRVAIALEIANTIEWGVPVLYMRSTDGELFTIQPPPELQRENTIPSQQTQPVPQIAPTQPGRDADRGALVKRGSARMVTKGQLLESGYKLYQENKFDLALATFIQASMVVSEDPEASIGKGDALNRLNRLEESLEAYEQAIRLGKNDAEIHTKKSIVLYRLNYIQESSKASTKAITLDPEFVPAHITQGDALFRLNRPKDALASYIHALSLDTNCIGAYIGKIVSLEHIGERKEIVALCSILHSICTKRVREEPKNGDGYLGRSFAFATERDANEELVWAERAIEIDRYNTIAYLMKGRALGELGRLEEARVVYELAISKDRHNPFSYVGIAHILIQQNRCTEATQFFEQALKLDRDLVSAYLGKGIILNILQKPREALLPLEEGLRRNTSFAPLHFQKGNALIAMQNYKEAFAAYEKATQYDRENAEIYGAKADVMVTLNDPALALPIIDLAIQLAPEQAIYYWRKGSILSKLERYEEACAALQQCIRLEPRSASYHAQRGELLIRLKKYPEALDEYEQAALFGPDDASYHMRRGQLLYALEKYSDAVAPFEQALRINPKLKDAQQYLTNIHKMRDKK